jgi:Bacterial conjugation TrbI-like protein
MDIHNNQPATPSAQDLASIMNLDLAADDPVSSSGRLEQSEELMTESPAENEVLAKDHDVFNDEEFNPEKNRTKINLQNSGVAKAALVSGAGLAVILGGMMAFQGQLPKEQVAQIIKQKDPGEDKVSSAQAAATKAQQSESETKAQLALAKQKDSLAQAQLQDASKAKTGQGNTDKVAIAKVSTESSLPVVVTPIPRATRITPVTATVASSSMQPVSRPAPVTSQIASTANLPKVTTASIATVKRKAHSPIATAKPFLAPLVPQPEIQLMASKSVQKPSVKKMMARPIASPGMGAVVNNNNPLIATSIPKNPINNSPTDPNAELQQLAAAGRYGTVSSAVEVPASPSLDARNARGASPVALAMGSNLPPLSQYFQRYNGQEKAATTTPVYMASNITTGARTAFANSQEILQGNAGIKSVEKEPQVVKVSPNSLSNSPTTTTIAESPNSIKTLLVGTSAKGSAVTPVLWGAGANSNAKFLLKLDEPMLDGNNRPAFPAGTQFVVTAKPANASIGLAELEVVSVIIQGMEFAPPSGAIAIRDDQGGLLIGEDYFKRNEQIANRDLMTVFSGALGGVGRILNQPSSTVSSSVNGSIANTTNIVTNREPNILGAVLEGGFQDLSAVWSQRNQQAIQELTSKPNVYQLPKGKAVRVFVNQSMTF